MDREKIEKQLEKVDMEILSDLRKDLADEMSKPTAERDNDLISELNKMISQIEEELIDASKKRLLNSIMKNLDEYEEPKHLGLYKRLSAIAACFLLVLGLNAASLKVFGQNMFSAAYQFTKGGITISAGQPENSTDISASSNDPYGMKAKCAEYGFFPDTPSYIPDGFILDDVSIESNDYIESIIFLYRKDNIKLNFYFKNCKTNDEMPSLGIPTDTYNVIEEQVNGRKIYILKEDGQFTADYFEKGIDSTVFAEGLDYDECYKILESMS